MAVLRSRYDDEHVTYCVLDAGHRGQHQNGYGTVFDAWTPCAFEAEHIDVEIEDVLDFSDQPQSPR